MSINQCQVTIEREEGLTVVAIFGALDSIGDKQFSQILNSEFVDTDSPVILDFSRTSCIVSKNLHSLLSAYRQASDKSRLALCCASGRVRELFEFVGFPHLMGIYDDLESAREGVRH